MVNVNDSLTMVLFRLDDNRYALPLAAVAHVIQAVEVTALPDAPSFVDGVINLHGKIVPVFNLRRRLRLQQRSLRVSDQFILASTGARSVALVVDEVLGICMRNQAPLAVSNAPGAQPPFVAGVIVLDDGLVVIPDLERFLSPAQAQTLELAMDEHEHAH